MDMIDTVYKTSQKCHRKLNHQANGSLREPALPEGRGFSRFLVKLLAPGGRISAVHRKVSGSECGFATIHRIAVA
ncbi:hypothetical protein [uncultured Sphaerotilus sp.]|uniref:hypothetical protein n=1 Tax=uncultured Sphaerotilus sp. TaxID=474984 RepID=UPI0030CA1A4D